MPIARTSGSNARRIEYVKRTVALIQKTSLGLTVRELADAMTVSDSAVKGYLWAMLDGGIVTRKRYKDGVQHPFSRYTVIGSTEQIDSFMEGLKFDPSRALQPRAKAPRSVAERLAKDPTRHVHIIGDDEPVKVRISKQRIPAPDPVLAAFYGMATA